ncbi:Holliday junction branch migration DNA helicase RuvB, partial [Candidatus Babeliales bacterium]|nr:Holliday junction branch migration DNA helicase RuvB [Candidatus Babeliales bacterium]
VQACKTRDEALDHMLLFGPAGLGKTTLCQIMAHMMQVQIKICSGPMLEKTGDLVAILSGLQRHDILFIDEIHRTPTAVEEILYSAMQEFKVDVIIGQGPGARTVSLPLQPFTLIGATTKSGAISAPLRSRFGIIESLDFYTLDELTQVIIQNAKFLNLIIDYQSASAIAKRARGTPRIAKKLLRRVRDFAQIKNNNNATPEIIEQTMQALEIDDQGLTKIDHLILRKILLNYNGGPVGLETLASITGQDKETIETVYEPYLLQQGFLEKTNKGRIISPTKYHYLQQKLR